MYYKVKLTIIPYSGKEKKKLFRNASLITVNQIYFLPAYSESVEIQQIFVIHARVMQLVGDVNAPKIP